MRRKRGKVRGQGSIFLLQLARRPIALAAYHALGSLRDPGMLLSGIAAVALERGEEEEVCGTDSNLAFLRNTIS